MILLSEIEVRSAVSEVSDKNIRELDFVAVDPWSVVTVRKFRGDRGQVIGSKVQLAEGAGTILVSEEMVDVTRMVEFAIKEHENGDDTIIAGAQR